MDKNLFKGTVLGHPSQLFVLFFTEMWERFSYYGMRALLVLFLTTSLMGENPGWGWERSEALGLYGIYTGLVYFTPLFGGMIADKLLGYRIAVIIGGFTMAAGHLFMAIETPFFFYLGLTALILGNGLFKPNISSMVGQLYDDPEKKDGAYTIFYMGINAGAFLGILLCGYIGESIGWSYGFGLATIFMIVGSLQFMFAKSIFGDIGSVPTDDGIADTGVSDSIPAKGTSSSSRISKWAIVGIILAIGVYFLNKIYGPGVDVSSAIGQINSFMPSLIIGAFVGILGFILSDPVMTKIESDRIIVIIVFTLFTIFFWWAFEQAGGSMTVFANDYTERNLVGGQALTFKIVNALLTCGAMAVITWVLIKLFNVTFKEISLSNIILSIAFVIIWGIVLWMLKREFSSDTTEVPASWFSVLNSFFIITFASLFSKFWEMKIITSGPIKFALGLFLVGLGFAFLAYGASGIPQGAKTASVSLLWLVLAYLFHSLGEL
ncbi:MAG: peptide MFS transporter, partial [Bacteroidia bacterium]|nr:peptide MFS transporter [Bacteroidia bacterium]